MKIVVSGGTGYIGGQVLSQCLEHPSVTSVLLLVRRDPGELAQHPKIKVIILKDFTAYDELATSEVQDADAAIWCLGTYNGNEKIDIDFPLAFINVIKARPSTSKPFRYVQLGGAFTEPPPKEGEAERSLWYFAQGRRVRGKVEAKVMACADDNLQSMFSVYLVKPAAVFSKSWSFLQGWFGTSLTVRIKDLSAMMVDLALRGGEQKILYNWDIIKYSAKLEKS